MSGVQIKHTHLTLSRTDKHASKNMCAYVIRRLLCLLAQFAACVALNAYPFDMQVCCNVLLVLLFFDIGNDNIQLQK